MQAKQQQQHNDTSLDMVFLIIGAMVGIGLIWYFNHAVITQFIYKIKFYEIVALNFAISGWNALAASVHLPLINNTDISQLAGLMQSHRMSNTYKALEQTLTIVGNYTRFPFAIIMALLAVIVYFKNVTLKFKNVFNMKSMKNLEQKNWPQIIPIVGLDLVKEDINKGPWAMAKTPMQFCKENKLLLEKREEGQPVTVELIRGEAQQLFVLQLGPLWTSVDALPLHAKALFAAFAACANSDRASATRLFHAIDTSISEGQISFAGTDELLAKHINSKVVVRVLQKHAYTLSIFLSMLELARTDGVLATSEFLWLKPLNRRLWYVLNTVGRQTPVPEVAGPYAHWLAEKKWGNALRTPMVEEAVRAMEIALSEIIYETEEEN